MASGSVPSERGGKQRDLRAHPETPPLHHHRQRTSIMTHAQACRPCAKRKVRCDKLEPCSNCKRRTDRCVYPTEAPSNRIRELERLVQELGGTPKIDSNPHNRTARNETGTNNDALSPAPGRSNDPMMLEVDGNVQYLESRAWHGWRGRLGNDEGHNANLQKPNTSRPRPHALVGSPVERGGHQKTSLEPVPQDRSTFLWDTFIKRVEPFMRVLFSWSLQELKAKSTEQHSSLSASEDALVSAIYYAATNSLLEEECQRATGLLQSALINEHQARCESALLRMDLLCITDFTTIRAIVFYVMASVNRLSPQSLWSLMGMTVRNAEKLGLHRDGTVLGLSPMETEERRRLWWQLQQLDLVFAVRMGLTPMTLTADWDVKLPLNIEDEDIHKASPSTPTERKSLTSMSYCLFPSWVINQQRQSLLTKNIRFELSWQANNALSESIRNDLVTHIENGINQTFLQYCDPLNPLDQRLQLFARLFIASTRLRVLHTRISEHSSVEERAELLAISVQSLRYNIAIQTQPSLLYYRWLMKGWLVWQAFMIVLIEASGSSDIKGDELWELLSKVYEANPDLYDLADDRRKLHAAELIVAASKAHRAKHGSSPLESLMPFEQLKGVLAAYRAATGADGSMQNATVLAVDDGLSLDIDLGFEFDMDFHDIDWSFWNSID
ncbi:hypothetical protein CC86DRAFT_463354 [Ophiobolus disseminans]|uniref:Zn(2)-C6 fungal-type domain-containing protein n=1 Tax=Ophiobolus disseminans TaxID=1469910 RepID=A0A6A7ADY7_9PLEO|nr:hypothetical protein CC86DRAFT_463354 [Ophiobolus disseminans]